MYCMHLIRLFFLFYLLSCCTIQAKITDLGSSSGTFTFSSSDIYYKGESVSITPTGDTSGWSGFSISPSLPAGLIIDSSSGIISGSPTTSQTSTNYTISANSSSGSTTATISFAVGLHFTVNNNADTNDNSVGDQNCADSSGFCTLRSAIQEQNNWSNIPLKITIPSMTITLGATEIAISKGITFVGAGVGNTVIQAGAATRIFNATISTPETLTFSGMTIQNGNMANDGGGVKIAGGSTVLSNCRFFNNRTSAGGKGGALHINTSNLDIKNCIFDSNQTAGSFAEGGAIFHTNNSIVSVISISDSSFISNISARTGAAIRMTPTTLYPPVVTISNTTFESNSAANQGVFYTSSLVKFNMSNSLFYANAPSNHLLRIECANPTDCTINQSTLHTTTVTALDFTGYLTVKNSTIVGGNGVVSAVQEITPASISFYNSIVSNSAGGNVCMVTTIVSNGYNINSNADCGFSSTGDQSNQAHLTIFTTGTPANNGGSMKTIELKSGGPAIDAGPATCDASTDQRGTGYSRPVNKGGGLKCDVGAFEMQ